MDSLVVVSSIGGALMLGAMSPGPSFVMVARTTLAASRADGIAAAVGMGAGGLIFATAALVGLHTIFAAAPGLYGALKVLGGSYLIFLAYQMFRNAVKPLPSHADNPHWQYRKVLRSFALGFITQVSNPKTAVVYASVFASLLPPGAPLPVVTLLPPLIFAIEAGWYAIVAISLSEPYPRRVYMASKVWVDRSAGAVMGLLGGKLILEAHSP